MTGYDLDPEDMILELDPYMVIIYWIHFHSLSFSHVHSIAIFVLITFNTQKKQTTNSHTISFNPHFPIDNLVPVF